MQKKIDKLEASSQSRHDTILTKLTTLETTTSESSAGLEGMNQEMEAVKQTLQKKADIVQVELLEKKLEEIVLREIIFLFGTFQKVPKKTRPAKRV